MGAVVPGGQRRAEACTMVRAAAMVAAFWVRPCASATSSSPWASPSTWLRDYAFLRDEVMRQHNWTLEHAEGAIVEYLRFAELLSLSSDRELIASTDVDAVWHEHVLDTENYALDCQGMWGRYVHHRRVRTASERADIPASYGLTKQRYLAHFGSAAPGAYWGADTQASSLCGGSSRIVDPLQQITAGGATSTTTTSSMDMDAVTMNMTTTLETTTAAPAVDYSVLAYMGISLGGGGLAACALAFTHRCVNRKPPEPNETFVRRSIRMLTLNGVDSGDQVDERIRMSLRPSKTMVLGSMLTRSFTTTSAFDSDDGDEPTKVHSDLFEDMPAVDSGEADCAPMMDPGYSTVGSIASVWASAPPRSTGCNDDGKPRLPHNEGALPGQLQDLQQQDEVSSVTSA